MVKPLGRGMVWLGVAGYWYGQDRYGKVGLGREMQMWAQVGQRVQQLAEATPDTPKQLEAAVIAIVLGLLMLAAGITLLLQ